MRALPLDIAVKSRGQWPLLTVPVAVSGNIAAKLTFAVELWILVVVDVLGTGLSENKPVGDWGELGDTTINIPFTPIRVVATGSAHARPSAQPPSM